MWHYKHTGAALLYLNSWKIIRFCEMLFRAEVLPAGVGLGSGIENTWQSVFVV